MEIFGGDKPYKTHEEELRAATPANGEFLRINLERVYTMPDDILKESLEEVKLGYDCPCLKGEECESTAPEEFMRLRMAVEAHRASVHEFPDNDAEATYTALIEDVAEMLDKDPEQLAALAIFTISRLNSFERAYRVLKESE